MDRGADLQRLRDLATTFGEKADNLQEQIIDALSTLCDESTDFWKGPKADQFRSEFQEVKPTFQSFVDALRQAKESANTNADNIEQAT
ncbi:WXG100 family type VII secretion target [Streptomyces sp. 7-21]|uniref:WXG100 family type VII secretion target n=1 Tax=Streptomyces sp. 7-21 TaxID=2802283 RepID=UPI00191EE8C0|nr:WXG100 family type VII secretion target [Streptomyces sp. 7-21]MBL1066412.1 WXG100 family type VII secretion target [Streptomyces sp. 7-21]